MMEKVLKLTGVFLFTILLLGFNSKEKIDVNNLNSCTATLKILDVSNKKSILPNRPVSYHLELKNNSSTTNSYTLLNEELKVSCYENRNETEKKEAQKSVKLESSIVLNKAAKSNENAVLILKPGESYNFKVVFNLSEKTSQDTWSCTKVSVISKECNTVVSTVILKTYIPNSNLR